MTITAAKLAVEVGADTSKAESGLKKFDSHLSHSAKQMGGHFSGIGSSAASAVAGMGRGVLGAMSGLGSAAGASLRGAASVAGAAFRGLASAGMAAFHTLERGAAMAAKGIAAIGIAAGAVGLNTAADMEQANVAFTTMLGSAEAAKTHMRELADFSAKTPFELKGVISMSRQLQGMGFAADEVKPLMTAVGDSVAAMGGGAVELERVTRALGQMKAKGKVSAEEMMQLSEIGINGWELLASATGKSVSEVQKLASEGKITADVFIKAFKNMQGPLAKFKGAMEAQSKTLRGMWSTLKDTTTLALAEMATPIAQRLQEVFPQIQSQTEQFFRGITPQFTAFAGGIVGVFANLMPVVGPIIQNLVGAIGTVLTAALPGFAALTGKIGTLFAGMGPAVDEFAKAAGGHLDFVLQKLADMLPAGKDVEGVIDGLKEKFKPLFDAAKEFGGAFVDSFDDLAPLAGEAFKNVVAVIAEVLQTLAPVVKPFLTRALETIVRVLESVLPHIEPTLGAVADAVIALFDAIGPAIEPIVTGIATVIQAAAEALAPAMPAIVDALKAIVQAIAGIAPEVFRNLADAIVILVQGISSPEVLKGLADAIVSISQALVEIAPHLPTILPPLLDIANTILPKLADTVVIAAWGLEWLAKGLAWAVDHLGAFVTPALQAADALMKVLDVIRWFGDGELTWSGMLNFIRGVGDLVLDMGRDFGATVRQMGMDWIRDHPQIVQWVIDTYRSIRTFVSNVWNSMVAAGNNLIKGLWEGIRQGWNWLETNVGGLASSVIGVFKNIFDLGSPSRVTRQHGLWLMEGLADGVTAGTRNVLAAVGAASSNVNVGLVGTGTTPVGAGAAAASAAQGPVTIVLQVDRRTLGEVTIDALNRLSGETTLQLTGI